MQFKGEGNTVVWDRERERELCRFNKGVFESDDFRTCSILLALGYAGEGELPADPNQTPPAIGTGKGKKT